MIGEQASWAWVGHCKTPAGLGHVQVFHWKFDFAFFQPRKFEFTFFRMRKFKYADQVWTSLGPNKKFTLVPVIYPRGPWPLQLQVSCKNTSDVCQNILISALLPDRTLFSTTYVVMPTPSRLNKRRYQTQIIRWPDKTYQNPWWQICWWRWILNRRRIIKIKLKLKVEIKNPQS